MINLFRLALATMWLRLLYVTVHAGQTLGWDQAGDLFFGDMAHPWRAQFNTDFFFFLLLIAAWMVWHAKSRLLGTLFAALSVMGGGLFTFAYLLVQSFSTKGNLTAVLLGRHYHEGASE
ncbi:MAG: hypothetical protein RL339_1593 [Pseudomonadota bacterium]|jgi:hypothetical protein